VPAAKGRPGAFDVEEQLAAGVEGDRIERGDACLARDHEGRIGTAGRDGGEARSLEELLRLLG